MALSAGKWIGKSPLTIVPVPDQAFGHPCYGGLAIEVTLKLQTLRNILDLLEHIEGFLDQVVAFVISVGITDSLNLVLMVTFLNAKGEEICGSVSFSNGDRYSWKLVDGVYYVLIDGEWVPVEDPDWKPGDELPSECD